MAAENYVRFVVLGLDRHSGRRQGIFQAAYALVRANVLSEDELKELRDCLAYFERNLRSVSPHPRAISWFKGSAHVQIRRMHVLCAILAAHNVRTQVLRTARIGYVAYEDEHQAAATPFADTPT